MSRLILAGIKDYIYHPFLTAKEFVNANLSTRQGKLSFRVDEYIWHLIYTPDLQNILSYDIQEAFH